MCFFTVIVIIVLSACLYLFRLIVVGEHIYQFPYN